MNSEIKIINEGQWHQILPFQREYEETDDLMEQSYNFNFMLTKSDYNIGIYMKAKNITTNLFQTRILNDQEINESLIPLNVYKYNYEFYLHDIMPTTSEIKRDKLYQLLADKRVKNTTVVISATRMTYYLPLQNRLRKLGQSYQVRIEGRRKVIMAKNSRPIYLVHVYLSTDDPVNFTRFRETLRSDHSVWKAKRVSQKKVIKAINRKMNSWVICNVPGYLINMIGGNVIWDTVLNETELTNYVILPKDPTYFSIVPGESPTVQQGFVIEKDEEEN
jgi:hypothetical protein